MLNTSLKYLPMKNPDGSLGEWKRTVFLKHFITKDSIEVGDFTYYDSTPCPDENPEEFENNNVLYFALDTKLRIGKFCALAAKCKFIMPGAVHPLNSFTGYPLFWNLLADPAVKSYLDALPDPKYYHKKYGDTVVGNDVWIGYDALILPGVKIGDGAVVGARSVVTKDIPPYTIVAGNPATVIRQRFDKTTTETLLALKWWDWPMEKIITHYHAIMNRDLEALPRV